jgi:phosphatidylglycerophosphate synthase
MFDHVLRGFKDRLLAPLATLFRSVSPNLISVIALLFGLGAAVAAWRGTFGVGLALWITNRVTDGLDGTVARQAERQTDFGGYLDILLDFVVYAAIPVGFAIGSGVPSVLGSATILEGAFFVNACSWMYLSAVLEKRQSGAASRGELTTVTMPPALVAGFETIVFFALFFLFPDRLTVLFSIMAAMVGVNIVQRLVWARRVLQ